MMDAQRVMKYKEGKYEVLSGRELPALSEALKDAGAVVGLLGAQSAPGWLLALSGSGGGSVRRAAVG